MDPATTRRQYPRMRSVPLSLVASLLVGCGAFGSSPSTTPPPADPAFPIGFEGWLMDEPVTDEGNGELRRLFRSPDGAVLVKAHHALIDDTLVRLDVRVRQAGGRFGGWRYLGFDPATRQRTRIDAETCHLCHAAAPRDGTYSRFR